MMNRAKQRRSDSNRSEKVCPVCSGSFRYDLAMMNLHVDACLGKSSKSLAQREAEAALKEAAEAEEEEEEEEWEVSLEKRASSSRWVRWVEREVGLQNAKFM